MNYTIEIEQEDDGRWIADVVDMPGVMVYGATREEAVAQAQALALRAMAEVKVHKTQNDPLKYLK